MAKLFNTLSRANTAHFTNARQNCQCIREVTCLGSGKAIVTEVSIYNNTTYRT